MDKFPEAFKRFEKAVDTRNIRSWKQLQLAFRYWAGSKWYPTHKQLRALKVEAKRLGLMRIMEEPRPRSWRHETITVKGKIRSIYRDLETGRFVKKPF